MGNRTNLAEILPELNETSDGPIDKDGSDGETRLIQVVVDVALNGYMLTLAYDDGSHENYVTENFDDVIDWMRRSH